jgi:hypothetical protein
MPKSYYFRYYCSELLASQKVQKLRNLGIEKLKNIYENLQKYECKLTSVNCITKQV